MDGGTGMAWLLACTLVVAAASAWQAVRCARRADAAQRQLKDIAARNAFLEADDTRRREVEDALRRQSALLEAVVASLPQGISVFDDQLRLVAWNADMVDVLELPPELVHRGVPFEDLIRVPARRGDYGPGDPEELVRERRELAMKFEPHRFERVKPSGRAHLVVGKPFAMDGRAAGFITTYTDITERRRMEEDLRRGNQVLQSILDNLPGGVSVFGGDLKLIAANRKFRELLELPDALFAAPNPEFASFIRYNAMRGEYGECDIEAKMAELVERARHPVAHVFERERPDGRALEVRGGPLPGGGFITIYSDITERKRAERELYRLHERLALAIETVGIGIWDWDVAANQLVADRRVFDMFGVAPADTDGRFPDWLDYLHPDDRPRAIDQVKRFLRGRASNDVIDYRIVRPDGEVRCIEVHTHVTRNEAGRVLRAVGVDIDVTDKKRVEEHIKHLAHHDRLTGLPNRMALELRLDQSLAEARRSERGVAVMFLDLDRFKAVNDTLGHHVGDLLLIEVARRLKQAVRASDTVARLGGDEFVVVLPGLESPDLATMLADGIVQALAQPYVLDGRDVASSPSVGIALWPQDGIDVATLMKHADTAMYHAKAAGRNTFRFFAPSMNAAAMERLDIERSLREALEQGQFLLYYQPRIDMTGRIVGAEALVRWQRPQRGLIAAGEFIPIAEETDLVVDIGAWALRTACAQLCAWRAAGLPVPRLSINLSARQLRETTLLGRVAEALADAGLPPEAIEFELSESAAMESPERTARLLRELRSLGIGLSIDDFGTGYSSLAQLKRLPVDALKIDRSFVADIVVDTHALAVARATIALAHALGLTAVAEGVETAAQFDLLHAAGCDAGQGMHWALPLPADAFAEFLRHSYAADGGRCRTLQ